jgi:hypothetical protein
MADYRKCIEFKKIGIQRLRKLIECYWKKYRIYSRDQGVGNHPKTLLTIPHQSIILVETSQISSHTSNTMTTHTKEIE